MPNGKNLIPFDERTESEQREIRSKGGKASGAARRRKRDMAKAMKLLLDLPVKEGTDACRDLRQFGVGESDMTNQMAMLSVMLAKAASGDVRAAEFVRDTAGYNPKIRLEERRFEAERDAGGGTDVVSDWINAIPDVAADDGGDDPDGADDESAGEEEEAP